MQVIQRRATTQLAQQADLGVFGGVDRGWHHGAKQAAKGRAMSSLSG